MANKRKVLSLIRVSSQQQADPEKDGIPRQLRDIEAHCLRYGLEVVHAYQLEGVSGTKVQFDGQFKAMLSRVQEPQISGVVISRMDRFFRPQHLDTAYSIFQEFRKHKKLLFCDLDELAVWEPQDAMKIQLWGMVAGQERRNIAERNSQGKASSRLKATTKTDPLPMGVVWDPTTGLFSYSAEAVKIKASFEGVDAGDSLGSLWKRHGFGSHTTLRRLLQNQWFIGNKTQLYRREYRTDDDVHGRKVLLNKPIITATNLTVTPLVTNDLFMRVQAILDKKKNTWSQTKTHGHAYLSPGVLHCTCGRKMYLKIGTPYVHSKNGKLKPAYYICASKANGLKQGPCKTLVAVETDKLISWEIAKYFIDSAYVAKAMRLAQSDDNRSHLQSTLDDLGRRIGKLESKRARAIDLALEDDVFVPRVKILSAEINSAQVELLQAQSELALMRSDKDIESLSIEMKERFFMFSGKFDEMLTEAERALVMLDRKALLQGAVERVTVSPDNRVTVVLRGTGAVLDTIMSDAEADVLFESHMKSIIGD